MQISQENKPVIVPPESQSKILLTAWKNLGKKIVPEALITEVGLTL